MRAHELLSLPVGTEVRWKDLRIDGRVTAHGSTSLMIAWSDGTDTTVSTDDFYVGEMAYGIELLAPTPIETPILVHR